MKSFKNDGRFKKGHNRTPTKWTKDAVLKKAIQYSHASDWCKASSGSYAAALKKGWYEEATQHMQHKCTIRKWTKEAILKEAKKYKRSSIWEKKSQSSYVTAVARGWLPEATSHMNKRITWTAQKAKDKAKQYRYRCELKDASSSAYNFLRKHGMLNSLFPKKPSKPLKWTFEKVKKIALRFSHKSEWSKKHRRSYDIAHRNGWIDKLSGHMKTPARPLPKWDKKNVLRDAKKYKTKSEWWKASNGAHLSARKNGWFDEATLHMRPCGNSSRPEKEIAKIVQLNYPNAKKKSFRNNDLRFKSHRFELDIFIPELKKGIEFDGTYWHGEGFKRKNFSSPDEYHQTKDLFFLSKGIYVFHVKETDWKNNKKQELKKIKSFLAI